MSASKQNPAYTAFLVDGDKKCDITPIVVYMDFSDQKNQMACSVNIGLMNILLNGVWLTSIVNVRQRVFVYADDGEKKDEVFRGFVWNWTYQSASDDREIVLRCYDNLIYFQESEDSEYFSDGKSTKDIISALCQKWGVTLEYSYESITHSKLPLRGNLADIFTADILDLVKDRTGKKYTIRSEKDTVKILTVGQNATVYSFIAGENAISTKSECTMEGMVTKVIILGKADSDEREPVEATVSEKTDDYGTIQKVVNRDENTALADAKTEAQNMLNTTPQWEYEIICVDIPWVRKGDKVHVSAGNIYNRDLIVTGITRSIDAKGAKMTLEAERP